MFLYVLYKIEMPLAEIVLCQTKSILSSFVLELAGLVYERGEYESISIYERYDPDAHRSPVKMGDAGHHTPHLHLSFSRPRHRRGARYS